MKKEYEVILPITGYVSVNVMAESEEDAIQEAFQRDITYKDIESWECHENVCRGNVYYGERNSAEATEI